MPAVMDQAAEERMQDEIQRFKMPAIQVGRIVFWYGDADMGSDPKPAIVQKVGVRAITIRCISPDLWGTSMMSIHHAADPVLKYRENIRRECGGWDYSTQDRAQKEENDRLWDAIKELQRTQEKMIQNRKPKPAEPVEGERRKQILGRLQVYGVKLRKADQLQSTDTLEERLLKLEDERVAAGEELLGSGAWKELRKEYEPEVVTE